MNDLQHQGISKDIKEISKGINDTFSSVVSSLLCTCTGSQFSPGARRGDTNDPEMAATIRQRCMMAMYRFIDRGQIVKERPWGGEGCGSQDEPPHGRASCASALQF